MSRNATWCAALFAAVVVYSDPASIQADPPDCDAKCRARQYFYWPSPGNPTNAVYVKFEYATCEYCGSGTLCTIQTSDKDTDGTCKTDAGKESANTRWTMKSKSLCSFDKESSVEAEPATATGTGMAAAIKSCYAKGKEDPGDGGGS